MIKKPRYEPDQKKKEVSKSPLSKEIPRYLQTTGNLKEVSSKYIPKQINIQPKNPMQAQVLVKKNPITSAIYRADKDTELYTNVKKMEIPVRSQTVQPREDVKKQKPQIIPKTIQQKTTIEQNNMDLSIKQEKSQYFKVDNSKQNNQMQDSNQTDRGRKQQIQQSENPFKKVQNQISQQKEEQSRSRSTSLIKNDELQRKPSQSSPFQKKPIIDINKPKSQRQGQDIADKENENRVIEKTFKDNLIDVLDLTVDLHEAEEKNLFHELDCKNNELNSIIKDQNSSLNLSSIEKMEFQKLQKNIQTQINEIHSLLEHFQNHEYDKVAKLVISDDSFQRHLSKQFQYGFSQIQKKHNIIRVTMTSLKESDDVQNDESDQIKSIDDDPKNQHKNIKRLSVMLNQSQNSIVTDAINEVIKKDDVKNAIKQIVQNELINKIQGSSNNQITQEIKKISPKRAVLIDNILDEQDIIQNRGFQELENDMVEKLELNVVSKLSNNSDKSNENVEKIIHKELRKSMKLIHDSNLISNIKHSLDDQVMMNESEIESIKDPKNTQAIFNSSYIEIKKKQNDKQLVANIVLDKGDIKTTLQEKLEEQQKFQKLLKEQLKEKQAIDQMMNQLNHSFTQNEERMIQEIKQDKKMFRKNASKIIVKHKQEHIDNLNFLHFEKEIELAISFENSEKHQSLEQTDIIQDTKAHQDLHIGILENLLISYWKIDFKLLTLRGLYMRKLINKQENILNSADSPPKLIIKSLAMMIPLQIFIGNIEKALELINKTNLMLMEDSQKEESQKYFNPLETDQIMHKTNIWLAWVQLNQGKQWECLETIQKVYQKDEGNNLIVVKACEILVHGYTDDFIDDIKNLKTRYPNLQDFFEVMRNIIYLSSNDSILIAQARKGFQNLITTNKFIFLCTCRLYIFFMENQKFKLIYDLCKYSKDRENDREYHSEILWTMYLKSCCYYKPKDNQPIIQNQDIIEEFNHHLEEYPQRLLLFYQYGRCTIKYLFGSLNYAKNALEHVMENTSPEQDDMVRTFTNFQLGLLYRTSSNHIQSTQIFQQIKPKLQKIQKQDTKLQFITNYEEETMVCQEKFSYVLDEILKEKQEETFIGNIYNLWNQSTIDANLEFISQFDLYLYRLLLLIIEKPKDIMVYQKFVVDYPSRLEPWFFFWDICYKQNQIFNPLWIYPKLSKNLLCINHPYLIFKDMQQQFKKQDQQSNKFYIGLNTDQLWIINKSSYGSTTFDQTLKIIQVKSLLSCHSIKALKICYDEVKLQEKQKLPGSLFNYYLGKLFCKYQRMLQLIKSNQIYEQLKKMKIMINDSKRQAILMENVQIDPYNKVIDELTFDFIEQSLKKWLVICLNPFQQGKINYYLAEAAYYFGKKKDFVQKYYQESKEIFNSLQNKSYLQREGLIINDKFFE